jgi:1-acyl-sn-glycerol-3-phosphate acyltransferase
MMNFWRLLLRKTWRALFFLNGLLTFIFFFPLFYILLSKEKWFPKVFRLKKIWGIFLLADVGLRYKVLSKVKLDPKRAYIICPNHSSFLDIILTYMVIPNYFHFMGKAELKKVPLFNQFFNRMNILVDRSSIIASHKAFIRAGNDIDKGISIAIFPEATIPECAPYLGRFKNGAFRLAIDKQIPIVPVVFLDNWRLLPDGKCRRTGGRPGLSRVVIHEPIETKGMGDNDLEPLKKKVSQIISSTLIQYNCLEASDVVKASVLSS